MGLSAACSALLQVSGLPDTCDSFTHPCPWAFGLFPGLVLQVQQYVARVGREPSQAPTSQAQVLGARAAPVPLPRGAGSCRLVAHSPLAAAQGREGPQQVSLVCCPDAGDQSAMLRRRSRTSFLYSPKFPSQSGGWVTGTSAIPTCLPVGLTFPGPLGTGLLGHRTGMCVLGFWRYRQRVFPGGFPNLHVLSPNPGSDAPVSSPMFGTVHLFKYYFIH